MFREFWHEKRHVIEAAGITADLGALFLAIPVSTHNEKAHYVDRAKFHDDFCGDLSAADARVMAATQKPVNESVFGVGATVAHAAWKTVPSWFILTTQDRAINPDLQRFYAKRIGATTIEIKASHVSFLSHPREVAKVIEEAARATQ